MVLTHPFISSFLNNVICNLVLGYIIIFFAFTTFFTIFLKGGAMKSGKKQEKLKIKLLKARSKAVVGVPGRVKVIPNKRRKALEKLQELEKNQ